MKTQYIIGVPKKSYIRLTDGNVLIGGSRDIEDIQEMQKLVKGGKIYRLVEVEK